MKNIKDNVVLNGPVTLGSFMQIARGKAHVSFGAEYKKRVDTARGLVERFVEENVKIYGVTTGLGENVKRVIPENEAEIYQKNMIRTHCTTVGEPLDEEAVRAVMTTMLLNMGSGYAGVRLGLLEHIADFLNGGVVPYAPMHGSVGYLGVEAHIALVLMGEGKAWFDGKLLSGADALSAAGLKPWTFGYKEGLSIISGGTSATALAALAAADMGNLLKCADIVSACTLEALGGNLTAFDERMMEVKKQPEQAETAAVIRGLLKDSGIIAELGGRNFQDALSIRAIPQAHGAARRVINDAEEVVVRELNSCDDNPIIHPSGAALSGCNCDAGFVGMQSDALCIAASYLCKISERRTDRMVNEHVSGLPPFLAPHAGENNGYMIVQYSSAGLLGELRALSFPASADSVPTCAFQEDYVSMGYNAALKARKAALLAEYVIANELLTAVQALDIRIREGLQPSSGTSAVSEAVREGSSFMELDHYIHPEQEWAKTLIHSGRLVKSAMEHM